MQVVSLRPIGVVNNEVDKPVDEGWATVISTLQLESVYAGALDGLGMFSHALVVFWMHEAPAPDTMRRRPQGRNDMPELGILAQRARHRPNPIGITAVEIIEVAQETMLVRGLDAMNGTPILDIKPYFPQYDARPARTPPWVDELMKGYF
jgi:tRNA-Thr(GGU) m(6)t(6)A37 methyltransferase TsaA